MSHRALIVEDDRDVATLIDRALRNAGLSTAVHSSGEDALEAITTQSFDVVVADIRMAGIDGIEMCRRIHDNYPNVPVVVVTAHACAETAGAVMRAGAADLLPKPFHVEDLTNAVEQALASGPGSARPVRMPSPAPPEAPESLRGSSIAWRRVVGELRRVACSDATVLLSGESGVGKEVLARALHRMSGRHDGDFVAVSCAAIPSKLLEGELFGHVKGAFTGADADRQGLMLQAGAGTLLLDEIGAMPIELQPKLLRVLQSRRVRPVGASEDLPFEARLVAATNEDLHDAVSRGKFREDLLYRLEVLRIDVPPLRERDDDVLELARELVHVVASTQGKPIEGLSSAVEARLQSYPWPGNVRELRNCLEGAVALTKGPWIELEDLPAAIRVYVPGVELDAEPGTLAEVERRHIARVLRSVGGNRAEAARALGVSRSTLYRKLRKLGLAEQSAL